jgi:hypothetical protein
MERNSLTPRERMTVMLLKHTKKSLSVPQIMVETGYKSPQAFKSSLSLLVAAGILIQSVNAAGDPVYASAPEGNATTATLKSSHVDSNRGLMPYARCLALGKEKESTWRSRALAAAAELAFFCKAAPREREERGWISYRMEVCPLTLESYNDPFYEMPRIAVSRDGILIFTMPNRQGDQMRELVTKLRAAGHSLPMMAEYEDPWGERNELAVRVNEFETLYGAI